MPEVTDEFVKSAQMLSKAVPGLLTAKGVTKEAAIAVRTQAEVVADTLIEQGLVKDTEKAAAVEKLSNHGETLSLLNRTAQQVTATSLGSGVEKEAGAPAAGDEPPMRGSDRLLLDRLGFDVPA